MSTIRLLPEISLRQMYRYLARYIRHHPASTRAIAPVNRIRVPTQPGVGVFFYPADAWRKSSAFAVGPLGETQSVIHPCKFQIARPIVPDAASATEDVDGDSGDGAEREGNGAGGDYSNNGIYRADILYWGEGGSVKVTKNILSGVTEGFAVTLELHGVGYRVEADHERNVAIFRLGFSHTIEMPLVDGDVFFNIVNPQLLQIAGINRADVHQMASKVRALRPPEPYKGKGIRYKEEPVRRKAAKKD